MNTLIYLVVSCNSDVIAIYSKKEDAERDAEEWNQIRVQHGEENRAHYYVSERAIWTHQIKVNENDH